MTATDLAACPDCTVQPGTAHEDGCDQARCPDCGEQLLMCGVHDDDLERPVMWHGVQPDNEACRKLDWWITVVGVPGRVEDTQRVAVAAALGQVTWNPMTQRYDIGEIDNTVIDRYL